MSIKTWFVGLFGLQARFFEIASNAFDTIPVLSRFKGWRSVIGLVGITVLYGLDAASVQGGPWVSHYGTYFTVFTGLALNAKER